MRLFFWKKNCIELKFFYIEQIIIKWTLVICIRNKSEFLIKFSLKNINFDKHKNPIEHCLFLKIFINEMFLFWFNCYVLGKIGWSKVLFKYFVKRVLWRCKEFNFSCKKVKNSIKDFSLNSLRIFRIIQKGLKRRCAAKIAHWASFSRVTWPIFRRTTRPKPLWQAWKFFKFNVDLIGCSKLKLTLIIIQIFVGICLN